MRLIAVLVVLTVLVISCGTAQAPSCPSPYVQIGDDCCLDNDNDGICNKDEVLDTQPFKCNPPYVEFQTGSCCLDKNNNSICDSDEKEPELEDKSNNDAEAVAKRFGVAWEKKEYGLIYDMTVSDLKTEVTRNQFIELIGFFEEQTTLSPRFDEIIQDPTNPDLYYAHFTVTASKDAVVLDDYETPAITVVLEGDEWKLDVFDTYLKLENLKSLCDGYEIIYDYELCHATVIGIITDKDYCLLFDYPIGVKECLVDIGESITEEEARLYCDREGYSKFVCMVSLDFEGLDISFCEAISDTDMSVIDNCLDAHSEQISSYETCDKYSFEEKRVICKGLVSAKLNDIEHCDSYYEYKTRQKCKDARMDYIQAHRWQ